MCQACNFDPVGTRMAVNLMASVVTAQMVKDDDCCEALLDEADEFELQTTLLFLARQYVELLYSASELLQFSPEKTWQEHCLQLDRHFSETP